VIVWLLFTGLYEIAHEALPTVTADSVHRLGLNVPLVAVLVKVTEPVGVVAVPGAVSLTVAVQCCIDFTSVQPTLVAVLRLVTVTVVLPLLVVCALSPP
jgi:hypothetical protein